VLSNEISRGFKADFEDDVLSGKQCRVLHYLILETQHKSVFQRDIELEFNMRRSSTSTMLTNMERLGVIRRESVDYDGRLKRIIVTEKGEKIKAEVLKDCMAMEAKLVNGISEDELIRCANVLKKMISNLKEA
jgi:DNA-binding MarR family transcriptional regulator